MNQPNDESFIDQVEESAIEASKEISADTAILARAIGGWRGAIDSGLPSIVFLVIFLPKHNHLNLALQCAVATAVVLAAIALMQRKSLQQVIAGIIGVAFSAVLTRHTGRAQDYYVKGIITNGAYGLVFLISVLVKRPLLGYILGLLRTTEAMKEASSSDETIDRPAKVLWRNQPATLRKYSTVTWLWTLMFILRFAVMYPLWRHGATGALGVASIVLGYPLYALVGFVSYLILRDKSEKSAD